jgi:5-deoxy-glucuronate isomerase
MLQQNQDLNHPANWKYSSPVEPGLHTVVSPGNSACKVTWIFRLNLLQGQQHILSHDELELNGVVIAGAASLTHEGESVRLAKCDSFYLPAGNTVALSAEEDVAILLGGGPYEGEGRFFVRPLDLSLPLGEIHQVHGEPPYRREVFMTVNPETPASRLICGLTWGDDGRWTSWPPHQHTRDLEEVYCFFDIPAPQFALHLCSRQPGSVEAVHPVSTGDCVAIPEGYHPTVGMPGVRSTYFWVMVAHSRSSRRYDLAVNDPSFG